MSLPLGAGRLTRERLRGDPRGPPSAEPSTSCGSTWTSRLDTGRRTRCRRSGWDRAVATSKTFRTLARLAGAAPSGAGPAGAAQPDPAGLRQVLGFIRHIPPAQLGRAGGGQRRPGPPAAGRCGGGRGGDAPAGRGRAATSARGRCARASSCAGSTSWSRADPAAVVGRFAGARHGCHRGDCRATLADVTSRVPVLLSSSSVFPGADRGGVRAGRGARLRRRRGDGLDRRGQPGRRRAARPRPTHYGVPVLSVHAPCLLVTQRVWSPDPWERLRRAAELAETLGAPTVVVHPPFTWQRDYARDFADGVWPAVADRFTGRARSRWRTCTRCGWRAGSSSRTRPAGTRPRPATTRTPWTCRTARRSHSDALEMADRMGAGLAHVHLGDGTGEGRDEHLVPGRGTQPCGELLALAGRARLHRVGGGGGRHPRARRAARCARPTCAPRWRSPAST